MVTTTRAQKMSNPTDQGVTLVVIPAPSLAEGLCYFHKLSGELVRAAFIDDDVMVADEYGGMWFMPPKVFLDTYVVTATCPLH